MNDAELTAERLREVLNYDARSGLLTWLTNMPMPNGGTHHCRIGTTAGYRTPLGYMSVSLDGKHYQLHRLVWLYVHGRWPPDEIDHINGVRSDNRIANLRLATSGENKQNLQSAKRHSKSGVLGVCWRSKEQKWYAQLRVSGKIVLRSFHVHLEDAIAARRAAETRYHPFHSASPPTISPLSL